MFLLRLLCFWCLWLASSFFLSHCLVSMCTVCSLQDGKYMQNIICLPKTLGIVNLLQYIYANCKPDCLFQAVPALDISFFRENSSGSMSLGMSLHLGKECTFKSSNGDSSQPCNSGRLHVEPTTSCPKPQNVESLGVRGRQNSSNGIGRVQRVSIEGYLCIRRM